MLNQLLANSALQNGLQTFLLGLLVVFLGIIIIIVFVDIVGKFFQKSNSNEKVIEEKKLEVDNCVTQQSAEEISDEVKAAIIAAISAYYYSGNEPKSKCDFIVKKIKRV